MMAILDRLLHVGEVFYLRGASYRLRGKAPVVLEGKPVAGSAPTQAQQGGSDAADA